MAQDLRLLYLQDPSSNVANFISILLNETVLELIWVSSFQEEYERKMSSTYSRLGRVSVQPPNPVFYKKEKMNT